MAKAENYDLAIHCLSVALGREISIDENLALSESGEWDSLKQVELLFVVEEETGVILDPDQLSSIVDLESLQSVLTLITRVK